MSSQPPRSENTTPDVGWDRCERRINAFLSGEFRDHVRDVLIERGPIPAEEFDRVFDDAVISASFRATRVGWGFGVSRRRAWRLSWTKARESRRPYCKNMTALSAVLVTRAWS